MRQQYLDELNKLKIAMEKAEKFSEKLPLFSDIIISDKLSEDSDFLRFGKRYKQIPLDWGIVRCLYKSNSNRTITNYIGAEYNEFLFRIYLNTYSLFGIHDDFHLDSVVKSVDVFFYDGLNSTFYATDNQITALFEALSEWYERELKSLSTKLLKIKIDKTKKDLEKMELRLKNTL